MRRNITSNLSRKRSQAVKHSVGCVKPCAQRLRKITSSTNLISTFTQLSRLGYQDSWWTMVLVRTLPIKVGWSYIQIMEMTLMILIKKMKRVGIFKIQLSWTKTKTLFGYGLCFISKKSTRACINQKDSRMKTWKWSSHFIETNIRT